MAACRARQGAPKTVVCAAHRPWLFLWTAAAMTIRQGKELTDLACVLCPPGVDMNWVAHDSDSFEEHKMMGWVTLNLESGTASGATSSIADGRRHRAVLAHGALMLLAFTLFFPLGALAARHKWLAGDNVVGDMLLHAA